MTSLVEFGLVVLGKKIFKISSMYFLYFIIISLWKTTWPFIRTSLNAHHSRNVLCQAWSKSAQCMVRREFSNFVRVFLLFCYYVPFERGVTLHLNKLKYPLPKDVLCLLWLKLWFWRRRWKCEMLTDRQTDWQTDGRHAIRKAHNGTPSNSIIDYIRYQ